MSKTEALSIFENESTRAKLNEIQAGNIESIQRNSNVFRFKSNSASLDEKAGSYIFKRYTNSESKNYGTARNEGKGSQLTALEIPVNVDKHKEIVEEVSKADVERFGVDTSIVEKVQQRKKNHQMTLIADTSQDFWYAAYLGAVKNGKVFAGIDLTTNNIDDQLETPIVDLETTKNKYVRGIPRTDIGVVVTPKIYSKFKTAMNKVYNANFTLSDEELQGLNGVPFFSEIFMPENVDYIAMVKESVAQPLSIDDYDAERIPLSNDIAIEMYYDYGTKALAGDLISVGIKMDPTHDKVEVVSELTGTASDTVYIVKSDSTNYNSDAQIGSSNYPAGTMFIYKSNTYELYKPANMITA